MQISRRAVVLACLVFLAVFGVYLWVLYGQLEQAFTSQEQFIPTRIYSDVTRVSPPQPRAWVEERLQALGYSPLKEGETDTITLHPIDYPTYLIPENHPVLDAGDKPITLKFQGEERTAPLQSIQIGGAETAELYLEPELVATLSRSNDGSSPREIRALVKFNDIPAGVWKAIMAAEDQHFLEHPGFDPRGIARAIFVNLKTLSFSQGGSTITQQLVKNLMARHNKNFFRKINELFLAVLLEFKYDKEQILERYLNEVYLGQVGNLEVHGVAEGAKHFFGKSLDELNLAEMALMAGLIRGPGYYSPYRYKDRAIERQRWVLKKMVETGQIAEGEMEDALREPIRLAPPRTSSNKAPYFTDFVKAELLRQLRDRMSETEITSAGFKVYTTLDMSTNTVAQRAVSRGIDDLEKRLHVVAPDKLEGALAAVDQSTGYIRALVGGRSYFQSTFNRILNMRRQVGSTFKPFVYLTALAKGTDPQGVPYGPGHPIEDAPWKLVFDHGRQSWAPRNYEREFLGWIPFRTALAHSINTAAAKLGTEVGIGEVVKTARALGIESDLPEVPSLALGVAELSPVELLRAYATIANHGVQDELTVIRGITHEDGQDYARFVYHPKQVFPAEPMDLLTDMLQTVFTDGTAAVAYKMGFDRPAAGKTGTTSHHRDSWFAGFTPQLTTVVWVGMDQNPMPLASPSPGASPGALSAAEAATTGEDAADEKPRIMLTGASSALPIWVDFMKNALVGEPPTPFPVSPYLTQVKVDRHSGLRASGNCPESQVVVEYYIQGREPSREACEPAWPESKAETDL